MSAGKRESVMTAHKYRIIREAIECKRFFSCFFWNDRETAQNGRETLCSLYLDSMNKHRWVALIVIGAWLAQIAYLLPLPSQTAAEMTASLGTEVSEAIAEMEASMWLGWALRLLLIPIGVFAGLLLYRQNPRWAGVYLGSALVYLVFFRAWQWLPFHAQPLESLPRTLGRVSLMVGNPGLLFTTLLFPLFLVAVGSFAFIELIRKRAHAI